MKRKYCLFWVSRCFTNLSLLGGLMVGGINRLLKDGQTPTSYKSTKSTKKTVKHNTCTHTVHNLSATLRLASKKANVVSLLVVRQTTFKLKHAHSHHVTNILLDTYLTYILISDTVVQWLALPPHSKKECGVCMFSLWLRGFSLGSTAPTHNPQ